MTQPKVFISYSWSEVAHRERVREWADRLIYDGIEIVIDQYDLVEGQDKFAFMEKMVTDASVTHVLIVCDKAYAQKADDRAHGVGVESQLISSKIYNSVDQKKFIPIVTEFSDTGEPYLPVFLKARIWVNFSTDEHVNENWEKLVRHIYGKPLYEKPQKGQPPIYITTDTSSITPEYVIKLQGLKNALLNNKTTTKLLRDEFVHICIKCADELRISSEPKESNSGQFVLDHYSKYLQVRNALIEWMRVEASISEEQELRETVTNTLERLVNIKGRPEQVRSWSDYWYEPNDIFAYEVFLYFTAILMKSNKMLALRDIFETNYMLPVHHQSTDNYFERFSFFYTNSSTLNTALAPEGKRLYSPIAELLKRNSTISEIPFTSIIEADLLSFLAAASTKDLHWYPQTYHYHDYYRVPVFFLKLSQRKNFSRFSKIFAPATVASLKQLMASGFERLQVKKWTEISFGRRSLWEALNIERWDTLN